MNKIELFGDTYLLRKTFDIIDTGISVYGYDVLDNNGDFLKHYDIEDKNAVISSIKYDIYR
ncbi:MAG: hypothetical protein QME51_01135 [Planctomycetota bacterium]|nr:hypothetical protein [Planctomycetota bacterium]MDI6786961.1 hypothetical protein [Planctomycetota bacterium]